MAKLMMVSEKDPTIAVIFTHVPPGTPGVPQGWRGRCTDCGPDWVMHRWRQDTAFADAERHILTRHRTY